MNFLKELFEGGSQEKPSHNDFQEGDVFCTQKDGKYGIFKVIKYEKKFETLHVKIFEEVTELSDLSELNNLGIAMHHAPIASNGFENPKLLVNEAVVENDLLGYLEYIKQTQNIDELVKYAQQFYKEAYALSSEKNFQEAINKYTKAIELIPGFFEAIDNKAFCFMDMGFWNEAIEGFKNSLEMNPNTLLATFSIGECYYKLKDYPNAKEWLEKAVAIDPNHKAPKDFLAKTIELMKA